MKKENKQKDLILVTDWEKVEADDEYLSDEWKKQTGDDDSIEQAKELQKEGELFYGYIVPAVDYAIYWQMDSTKVLINKGFDVIVWGEGYCIIENNHKERIEFEY